MRFSFYEPAGARKPNLWHVVGEKSNPKPLRWPGDVVCVCVPFLPKVSPGQLSCLSPI